MERCAAKQGDRAYYRLGAIYRVSKRRRMTEGGTIALLRRAFDDWNFKHLERTVRQWFYHTTYLADRFV